LSLSFPVFAREGESTGDFESHLSPQGGGHQFISVVDPSKSAG
jgi:hypothetical protein